MDSEDLLGSIFCISRKLDCVRYQARVEPRDRLASGTTEATKLPARGSGDPPLVGSSSRDRASHPEETTLRHRERSTRAIPQEQYARRLTVARKEPGSGLATRKRCILPKESSKVGDPSCFVCRSFFCQGGKGLYSGTSSRIWTPRCYRRDTSCSQSPRLVLGQFFGFIEDPEGDAFLGFSKGFSVKGTWNLSSYQVWIGC